MWWTHFELLKTTTCQFEGLFQTGLKDELKLSMQKEPWTVIVFGLKLKNNVEKRALFHWRMKNKCLQNIHIIIDFAWLILLLKLLPIRAAGSHSHFSAGVSVRVFNMFLVKKLLTHIRGSEDLQDSTCIFPCVYVGVSDLGSFLLVILSSQKQLFLSSPSGYIQLKRLYVYFRNVLRHLIFFLVSHSS